jgi:DNA polymerase III subunit gamma/tau
MHNDRSNLAEESTVKKPITSPQAPTLATEEKFEASGNASINQSPTPKKTEGEVEAPAISVAKFGELNLRSKFSINKKNSPEEEIENKDSSINRSATPFTYDQLKAKWNSYIHQLNKEGKVGLVATLAKNPFVLDENNTIHLPVDNRIQQMELDTRKSDLLSYLRNELDNYTIDLKIEVNEQVNDIQHLTSKDKFLKMAEKNPFLQTLRERLDLDLEY